MFVSDERRPSSDERCAQQQQAAAALCPTSMIHVVPAPALESDAKAPAAAPGRGALKLSSAEGKESLSRKRSYGQKESRTGAAPPAGAESVHPEPRAGAAGHAAQQPGGEVLGCFAVEPSRKAGAQARPFCYIPAAWCGSVL